MECYYDQAFIAVRDRAAEASLRVTTLPVARARARLSRLHAARSRPTASSRLIYDYDYVDPAPLARFSGKLTRYGDVAPLSQADDDQLCLVGPGDEVRLEFDASGLPPSAAGLDAQLCAPRLSAIARTPTRSRPRATPSGPLPWRGMPAFPFAARSSGPAIRPTNRTCAPIRRGRPEEGTER